MTGTARPTGARVALFPWGGVAEDYLGPIGVDLRTFAEDMTGGWLFSFAEALRRHNVATTIMYFASGVTRPERHVNPKSGVATLYLPPSPLYRRMRRWPGDTDDIYRPTHSEAAWAPPIQDLVRYFATPLTTVENALRSEACTVILSQEYENPRFDVLTHVGRRLGVPVYATFQGAPPASSTIERRVRRRTIHRAAGFVVASGPEADRLAKTYDLPPSRIARIPNPLDLELWHPEPQSSCREDLGLPQNARILVYHGRIELRRKGLDLLLAAWRRIVSAHPNADLRLHLVGSGQDDATLAKLIATEPVPGLRWVRRYVNDRAEMRRELSAGDAYVLPSRHEGFPVAPLEALACGLPIVAANAPGIADILPNGEADGGIVVPTDDAAALQHGLERLLFEPGLREVLATRARERVTAFCSLDAVGRRLSTFLTGNGQPPGATDSAKAVAS